MVTGRTPHIMPVDASLAFMVKETVSQATSVIGVRWQCVYVWCKSTPHQAAGSFPDMQALSVFPAEIIKMLALVVCITAWQKSNDELTINRSNAGNRTKW